jgi:hypothetical protein
MDNSKSNSEKRLDENRNVESNEAPRAYQLPPNRVARRLPTGEMPTSKNTLQSFESSSYPQPVTSATAIVNSEKPSSEATGEIVNDNELESTEFSSGVDEPIVAAIAAPVLEEAEATLYIEEVAQPENTATVQEDNNNPTPETKSSILPRNHPWIWMILAAVMVVVAVVIAVAVSLSCMDGECGQENDDSKAVKNSGNGNENDVLQPPTLSPTNSTSSLEPSRISPQETTAFPSSVVDIGRANVFIDLINASTLTGRTIRNARNGTSEDAALNWMITSDPWSRTVLLETESERFRARQRYALATLFLQPTTDGTVWVNTSGWLMDVNECNWYGINCTAVNLGNDTGTQMVVTSIGLPKQGIVGTLSSDLGLLSSMQNVEIFDNKIVGTIPDALSRWTNLTTFYVYENGLNGTFPSALGQWSNLQQISVAFNQFTGTLPSSIIQWTNLIYFSVANNQLNGTIPDNVSQWSNLDVFILRHNQFSGTLPNTIGQWSVIQYMNITENRMTGTIPSSIGQWSDLQTLTLRDNLFTGTLPSAMGSFTKMWYFDVSSNLLNGTIPSLISNWSTRLLHFAVENNNLTGSLPFEFCNETIATLIQADCWSDALTCDCCSTCF